MANHVWFSENKAERKGGPKPLLLNPLDSKSKNDYTLPIYKLSIIDERDYDNNSGQRNQRSNDNCRNKK